jgi:uncharacterized protein
MGHPTHVQSPIEASPAAVHDAPHEAPALDSPAVVLAVVCIISGVVIATSVRGVPGIGVIAGMVIAGCVLVLRRHALHAIGLTRPASWTRTLLLSVAFGVIIQFGSLMVLEPLVQRITSSPVDVSVLDSIRGNFGALLLFLALVWVVVVFVEEMLFRGFLMTELRGLLGSGGIGLTANLLLVSTVFGLAHWYQGPSGVLTTGLVGGVLGFMFIRTGFNLWLPILVHGVINTVGLTLIYLDVDQYLTSLLLR